MTDKAMVTPVRAMDLSNLLKHAFMSGQGSMTTHSQWVDYDPSECPAYERIAAALAQAPVAVKPLRWGDPHPSTTYPSYHAMIAGLRLHYTIRTDCCLNQGRFALFIDMGGGSAWNSGHDTLAEAQAAAQADYERRILAALAHPPAKREAGETLKPRDNVVVDSVCGIIVEPVEGWWKVQFRDGSIAVVRPSSIRAALEASHE